jgi:HK97 family phage prohead protease
MKLTFSTPIQAADTERRVISGKIMEYGAVGHTSVGAVVFEHGSIQIPSPGRIKLLAQHEPNNPIGRAQSFSNEGEFIYGSFKISSSSKGTDYLTLAAEDLVSGLSVGVEVIASLPTDTHLLVTSARLIEVSLVESPAFENAIVTRLPQAKPKLKRQVLPVRKQLRSTRQSWKSKPRQRVRMS